MVISDKGAKIISNAILSWAGEPHNAWHSIQSGKRIKNRFIESFNWRWRDDLLT